jgi:hypothetical protein
MCARNWIKKKKKNLVVEKMKNFFLFKFFSGTVLKSLPLKKILAEKTEKTEPIFDTDHN